MEPGQAEQKLETFLRQVIRDGGFELQYTIAARGAAPEETAAPDAGGFAVDFSGPDVPLLTARNGELLHAIESIAAELLGLAAGEHHLLAFDAEGFRAGRARSLEQAVEQACEGVKRSGRPHAFPPMNSRERRLIHLAAARHGITTASSGEGPRRSVVLYPAGVEPGNVHLQAAGGGGFLSPTLPGERRSQTPRVPDDFGNRAFGGEGRGNRSSSGSGGGGYRNSRFGAGDNRGGRFGRSREGSAGFRNASLAPEGNRESSDEPRDNEPSAEDRARAIRERFRKR